MQFNKVLVGMVVLLAITNAMSWMKQAELRKENQTLRVQKADLESLKSRMAELEASRGPDPELERLKADAKEVHKLRNEISQAKKQLQELETLRAQNTQLVAAVQNPPSEPSAINAPGVKLPFTREDDPIAACTNNMKQLGLAARMYALEHNNIYPRDLVSMKQFVGDTKLAVCPGDVLPVPPTWESLTMSSYMVVNPGSNLQETDPATEFLKCRAHGHVGLYDGSVQLHTRAIHGQ